MAFISVVFRRPTRLLVPTFVFFVMSLDRVASAGPTGHKPDRPPTSGISKPLTQRLPRPQASRTAPRPGTLVKPATTPISALRDGIYHAVVRLHSSPGTPTTGARPLSMTHALSPGTVLNVWPSTGLRKYATDPGYATTVAQCNKGRHYMVGHPTRPKSQNMNDNLPPGHRVIKVFHPELGSIPAMRLVNDKLKVQPENRKQGQPPTLIRRATPTEAIWAEFDQLAANADVSAGIHAAHGRKLRKETLANITKLQREMRPGPDRRKHERKLRNELAKSAAETARQIQNAEEESRMYRELGARHLAESQGHP